MQGFYGTFQSAIEETRKELLRRGKLVDVGQWQSMDISDNPGMVTHELFNHQFKCQIPRTKEQLQKDIKPNLPWAEDHFMERVSGEPLNPGNEYKNWPYFKRQKENDRHRNEEGKHAHTYMERFWTPQLEGIRFNYGNLYDVKELLRKEPLTRQAYLPIWFPEDTGAHHGERVPCSLGYHFMVRQNQLHIWYPMRSCDYFRHFRDDIYMAARMVQWMLDELRFHEGGEFWDKIQPGKLTMTIMSLHVFKAEVKTLERGNR